MDQDEENQVFLSSIKSIPEHPAVAEYKAWIDTLVKTRSLKERWVADNEYRAKYGLPPRTMDKYKG